jgi:hypothetical protein
LGLVSVKIDCKSFDSCCLTQLAQYYKYFEIKKKIYGLVLCLDWKYNYSLWGCKTNKSKKLNTKKNAISRGLLLNENTCIYLIVFL